MHLGTLIIIQEHASKFPGRTGTIVDRMANGKFVIEIDGMGEDYPYAFYDRHEIRHTTITVKKISHHPRAWL